MRARRVPKVDTAMLEELYATMARIRAFEEACTDLWERGEISGELHSSIGEEAVAAGIISHLRATDALAIDHRSTGPMVARGVELEPLLLELLGDERGLGGGAGGHMHLLSREHLAVSDGIVGSAGPLACGFGLSAKRAGQGSVAVAFFGEGAVNQGMLLEAFNLAVVWRLPVLFVCKDSRWSITTYSRDVTGADVDRRASAFGLPIATADGADVVDVWTTSGRLLEGVRAGRPAFLRVRVSRPSGHLLDDPFVRILKEPRTQAEVIGRPLLAALRRTGGRRRDEGRGLLTLTRRLVMLAAGRVRTRDPLRHGRRLLAAHVAAEAEAEAVTATNRALAAAARRD